MARKTSPPGLVSEFFNSTLGEGQRPTERRIQVEEQRITPVGDGVNPGQVVDARQVCVLQLLPLSLLYPFRPLSFLSLFFSYPALLFPFPSDRSKPRKPRSLPGLSAGHPRIGVSQKGQIELTGYKLDISSAGFRIKCLSVAHT